MARKRLQPRDPKKFIWWWVRHGKFGTVQYGVLSNKWTRHHPNYARGKHFGMTMPVCLYPTREDLPVKRTLIDLYPEFKDRQR